MELDTLVAECKAGDEVAWEALVRRMQGRIFGLCYHYLREREEARDVAQETFIRIYRAIDRFDEGGSFMAWAVTIARNCCIDRLRRLDNVPVHEAEQVDDPDSPRQFADGQESFADVEARRELLRKALEKMTEINREMILLKDIQGLKQREIAELLSIPLGTVKTRSHRARAELADVILELDPSYGT